MDKADSTQRISGAPWQAAADFVRSTGAKASETETEPRATIACFIGVAPDLRGETAVKGRRTLCVFVSKDNVCLAAECAARAFGNSTLRKAR